MRKRVRKNSYVCVCERKLERGRKSERETVVSMHIYIVICVFILVCAYVCATESGVHVCMHGRLASCERAHACVRRIPPASAWLKRAVILEVEVGGGVSATVGHLFSTILCALATAECEGQPNHLLLDKRCRASQSGISLGIRFWAPWKYRTSKNFA